MRKLQVIGRYLAWDKIEPFFYLGDTAWEIFHRLNREEMELYFSTRSRQGFTVIQGVALAEFEGVTTPNAYGRLPLLETDGLPDPARPDDTGDYSYWAHVDYALDLAAENGLVVALLPTWGDKFNQLWGKGPVIFTPENAYQYGCWLGKRYAMRENIIWMLGGDRPVEKEHRPILDEMARGLKETDPNHLITFHPKGCSSSCESLPGAEYIDFHTMQTSHDAFLAMETDRMMLQMAAQSDKPFMDSEPRYEDHPACFNDQIGYFWQAEDVRQNAYWNLMTGVCGHTYGNHCIWSMNREPSSYFPYTWQEALTHPGAEQMRHVKALRMSHDYFSLRHAPELAEAVYAGMGHVGACVGDGYAYVYSPLGLPFTVNLNAVWPAERLRAKWFDPRTGEESVFCIFSGHGKTTLVPPTQGKGCDWVLILESV